MCCVGLLVCCEPMRLGFVLLFVLGLRLEAALVAPLRASPQRPGLTMMAKQGLTAREKKLEAKGYWAGEWVCADCGYIYESSSVFFEELKGFWKCPQCAGPRRRFVKKAGGMTAQVDDSPLFIGMGAAVALIVGLVYVGLSY